MSAHRLIGYHFGGTSTVAFDAYGRSLLRHRGNLLIRRMPSQRTGKDGSVAGAIMGGTEGSGPGRVIL